MATSVTLLILLLLTSTTLPPASSTHHGHNSHKPPPTTCGGSDLLPWIDPTPPSTCSLKLLDLGLCLDVLGGLVHVGLGDAVQNYCCPVLDGLLELEAAVCLCTAIKLRVLNLNIYIPLSLRVLVTCGKDPPPGWFCPLN